MFAASSLAPVTLRGLSYSMTNPDKCTNVASTEEINGNLVRSKSSHCSACDSPIKNNHASNRCANPISSLHIAFDLCISC